MPAVDKSAEQELAVFDALVSGPKTLREIAHSCGSTTVIIRIPVRRLFRDDLLRKRRVGRQTVFYIRWIDAHAD